MTNDPIYNHLRELSWRRKLTGAEEAELRAWLAAHPEAQADWEAEAGLNAALGRLPDVPVPSNFTARVLQAAEREAAAELRRPGWKWRVWPRLRWLPKVAFAGHRPGRGVGFLSSGSGRPAARIWRTAWRPFRTCPPCPAPTS